MAGSRNVGIFFFFFFPRLEKQCNNILHLLSCHRNMSFLTEWNKYKVHVGCIYLLLPRWVVSLEMLTRNKVHSFLSGHRMFPPQSREHFLGYLLGEAWHSQRDCNTLKWRRRPGTAPGACRNRGRRGPPGARPTERCRGCLPPALTRRPTATPHATPPCSSNQQKPELVRNTPPPHQLSQLCPDSRP